MAVLMKSRVPFPMPPCFSQEKRHGFMEQAMKKMREYGFGKLQPSALDQSKILTLVGFGPSLEDTWKDVKHPVMTMSGAHDFLIERDIIPEFHCEMDPRYHKVEMLTPHKDVQYLMASVCYPSMWEKLKGYNVKIWHAVSGDKTIEFVKTIDDNALVVTGGSCMGLVAIHLGGVIGFNHFELHGYDGSYRGEKRHAGFHGGHQHGMLPTKIWGNIFQTSRIMENSNVELQNLLNWFPVFCVFHGEGRNQTFVKLANLPNCKTSGDPDVKTVREGRVVTFDHVLLGT